MPDFTHEIFFHCISDENWETTVVGKSGKYTVKWDKHSHLNRNVQFDFSCTCWAYRNGRSKYCKHIEKVKNSRCGWNQFLHGNKAVKQDNEWKCPLCGEKALPNKYAV